MVVLGVSALYHDAAAAIVVDGRVVAAAQEERFSRVKHDASLPMRAAKYCCAEAGITLSDVDYLVFYEKPLRKFERILHTAVATFPRSWAVFPRQMQAWLGDKLWMKTSLCKAFGIPADRVWFSEHHLSHAAAAFLASPFEEAAVLCLDGVGEWATTSLWRGSNVAPFLEPLGEVRFPHSLGLLYSAITAHLGFAVNEGEYKVMGMAAFGKPRFRAELDKLLTLDGAGGFALNMDYFSYHYHPSEPATAKLQALLGPPRTPGIPFGDADGRLSESDQHFADLAASVQQQLEDAVLYLARHAKGLVQSDQLCLAGGVALNAVANARLAAEGPFAKIWVQPAAGDAGGALGAALWAWHSVLGNPRTPGVQAIALGPGVARGAVLELLSDLHIPFDDCGEFAPDRAAADLADGKVVGWFEGRAEFGPRALGHRSILADPRSGHTQAHVNEAVKFRERFRPFAPAVLAEQAAEWFDIAPAGAELAAYMLTTARALQPERAPAVVHVDGTARVQVVRPELSPEFYRLIHAFFVLTDVPMVLNTSFNLKGEPMVGSAVDALATFRRSGLDILYLDGLRIDRFS